MLNSGQFTCAGRSRRIPFKRWGHQLELRTCALQSKLLLCLFQFDRRVLGSQVSFRHLKYSIRFDSSLTVALDSIEQASSQGFYSRKMLGCILLLRLFPQAGLCCRRR